MEHPTIASGMLVKLLSNRYISLRNCNDEIEELIDESLLEARSSTRNALQLNNSSGKTEMVLSRSLRHDESSEIDNSRFAMPSAYLSVCRLSNKRPTSDGRTGILL